VQKAFFFCRHISQPLNDSNRPIFVCPLKTRNHNFMKLQVSNIGHILQAHFWRNGRKDRGETLLWTDSGFTRAEKQAEVRMDPTAESSLILCLGSTRIPGLDSIMKNRIFICNPPGFYKCALFWVTQESSFDSPTFSSPRINRTLRTRKEIKHWLKVEDKKSESFMPRLSSKYLRVAKGYFVLSICKLKLPFFLF